MAEQPTIYEKAVTTDRPAELLAKRHGFESVTKLAESLPLNAQVLDVGSGMSPFGREVAALRPDVRWINFDYSYQDPNILDEATKGAPANVQYVAGDATRLSEVYAPETFDAVFSYWLLPHLSLDNPQPAKAAARAIFGVTKTGGLMSVGPMASQSRIPSIMSGPAIRVTKHENLAAERYAEVIASATKLSGTTRYFQKLANEVATPFFGTTLYAKRKGKVPQVLHPESGEYVSPFSKKGVHTAGRLTVTAARYASKQRNAQKQTKHLTLVG